MYYTGVYSWAPKHHGPPAVALAALSHETGLVTFIYPEIKRANEALGNIYSAYTSVDDMCHPYPSYVLSNTCKLNRKKSNLPPNYRVV
jgi:hypothetical protein